MNATPTLVPTRELRDLDPMAEPPESAGARALRALRWTSVTGGTVTAATLVGMVLAVVCAVGAVVVGAVALAVVCVVAVVVAAALVALAAAMVGVAACAGVVFTIAGVLWAVVALARTIGQLASRLVSQLREPALAPGIS